MRIRESVLIDRLSTDVFSFVSDPSRDTSWRSYLLTSYVEGGGRLAQGARVHQTYSYQGKTAEVVMEVTEFVPPERIGFRLSKGGVRVSGNYQFRAEDGGTRFSMSFSADPTGPAALFAGRVEREGKRLLENDLGRLKRALEGG